jgi:hypothetical protein
VRLAPSPSVQLYPVKVGNSSTGVDTGVDRLCVVLRRALQQYAREASRRGPEVQMPRCAQVQNGGVTEALSTPFWGGYERLSVEPPCRF